MFEFLIISDCHYDSKIQQSLNLLNRALEYVKKYNKIDKLFILGDICNEPTEYNYTDFERQFSKCGINKDIYALAGNHDNLELMKSSFKNIRVKEDVKFSDLNIVMIDSSKKPFSKMPLGSGRVNERDINRIKNINESSILLIHHPVLEVGSKKFKSIAIENRNDVEYAVLNNKNIKYILCGHGHSFMKSSKNDLIQYMSPSTAYGFEHKDNIKLVKTNSTGLLKVSVHQDELFIEEVLFN